MARGGGNVIGTGAVVLTANADGISPVLGKAQRDVTDWAKHTEARMSAVGTGKASGIFSKLSEGGGAGGAFGTAAAAVGGTLGKVLALAEKIPAAFGAVAVAVTGAAGGVRQLALAGREADSLGVPVDKFTALGGALKIAGIEGVHIGSVLGDLQQKSLEAVKGSDSAAEAFGRLGLRVSEVARMSAPDQLNAVADAISKLPPGARQADAALQVFGGSARQLLPLLTQGSAGIAKFADEAQRMGLAVNAGDMAKAQKAAESINRMEAAFEGIKTKILVAIAPITEAVAGAVGGAVQAMLPYIDKAAEAFSAMAAVGVPLFKELVNGAAAVAEQVASWLGVFDDAGGAGQTTADKVFNALRNVGKAAGTVWDSIKYGVGVMAQVGSVVVDGFAKIVDAFKNTVKDLLNVAGKLPDSLGGDWFRKQAEQVDGWGASIHAAADEMKQWGERQKGSFGNSAKEVDAWFDKIQNGFNRAQEVTKGKATVKDNGIPFTKPELSGAFERGTKEAYSIVTRNEAGNMLSQSQRDVPKQQLDIQKQINDKLGQLRDAINGAGILKVL